MTTLKAIFQKKMAEKNFLTIFSKFFIALSGLKKRFKHDLYHFEPSKNFLGHCTTNLGQK